MQMRYQVSEGGLSIDRSVFNLQLRLEEYYPALGQPSRTVEPNPPAPYGFRNNQIHVYDSLGIYLTEHHASRLIESVNFIFVPEESPFPIDSRFTSRLEIDGLSIVGETTENILEGAGLLRELSGEYCQTLGQLWIGFSMKGQRDKFGKRKPPRYIVRVSVCFG